MNKTRLTTIIVVLMLSATMLRADMLGNPKRPASLRTLTGKLSWTYLKKPSGYEEKLWLKLETADGAVANLGYAGRLSAPPTLDVEKFVGKKVTVTVMARPPGKPRLPISVESIKDMQEVPPGEAKKTALDAAPGAKRDKETPPAKP